jgi:transposase, IS5 family
VRQALFKCLLLQIWYKLSDPALEKSLARDLMFRRFTDIGLTDGIPDHSTLWRFRNLLEEEGHYFKKLILSYWVTT